MSKNDKVFLKALAEAANFARFQNQKIIGADNLNFEGSAIITPTHDSMLDPAPLLKTTDRKLYFLNRRINTRVELWNKIVNAFLQYCGAIQFDRNNPLQSLKEIQSEIERIILEEELLVIYPEGTRKKVDKLQPGAAHYVLKYDLDVVPSVRIGRWFDSPRYHVIGEKFTPERSTIKQTRNAQKEHISAQIEEAMMELKFKYKTEE